MLHKTLKFNAVSQNFFYSLNVKILANYFPCLYKTVQYKIVRKVWKWTKKQSEKHSQIIIALTSRPLFNKHKEQNSDHRSRTNVLRACKQRAGLNTKLRAGYRREAATWNWTVLCWTVFFFCFISLFLDYFVLDCFVYAIYLQFSEMQNISESLLYQHLRQ